MAHVLLDQCHDPTPPITPHVNERLFTRTSPTKKRLMDFPIIKRSSSPSPRPQSVLPEKAKTEEIKEKDHSRISTALSSTDVSSYKMSVLDGTHALEFTSLDHDGRQRKAHLCLFCGKVISSNEC